MAHRTLTLFAACAAFAISLTMVSRALAQEGGLCGVRDMEECFTACAAHSATVPEATEEEIIAQCVALPQCTAVSMTVGRMRSARTICDTLFGRTPPVVAPLARTPDREPDPMFCILPEGTDRDTAARNCRCPVGFLPLSVMRWRSEDRLRSLGVPPGHDVLVCADPLALRGAPGSVEERSEGLTHADLEPLLRQLENLEEAVEAQQTVVDQLVDEADIAHDRLDGHDATLMAQSQRIDVLTECIMRGEGHRITLREVSTGETHEYECPEILAAARRDILEQAREAARQAALANNGGRAFVLFQGFILVAGPELRYGNAEYDLPWGVGGELALGIGLGGGWYIRGGLGLAAAWPDIAGMTNVMVVPHLGVGTMFPINRDVHLGVTFGGIAPMRFLPNGFLGYNLYGGFLELMLRVPATSEWSFVASVRGFGGVVPREVTPGNFEVGGGGGAEFLLGFGHF